MKVGSADRRSGNPHDGIARILDDRARLVLPGTLSRTVIDQRFQVVAVLRGVALAGTNSSSVVVIVISSKTGITLCGQTVE